LSNCSLYNAQISAGSLLLKESREIARLMLKDPDEKDWYQAIFVKNILQKKSTATAKRMTRLIRNRLEAMPGNFLKLVVNGSTDVINQALLAAAIKHSRLLRSFIEQVVKDHFITFNNQLSLKDWEKFLNECEQIDSSVGNWSESTKKKLGQVIFRILAEAKYLDSTRSMKILPVQMFPEVRRYLEQTQQTYILQVMEIA
jgi:hypothetical protein